MTIPSGIKLAVLSLLAVSLGLGHMPCFSEARTLLDHSQSSDQRSTHDLGQTGVVDSQSSYGGSSSRKLEGMHLWSIIIRTTGTYVCMAHMRMHVYMYKNWGCGFGSEPLGRGQRTIFGIPNIPDSACIYMQVYIYTCCIFMFIHACMYSGESEPDETQGYFPEYPSIRDGCA
jgi:hypothetical protein